MNPTYSVSVQTHAESIPQHLWLRSRAWDLGFISLSSFLVAIPILTYMFANYATSGINATFRSAGIDFTWDDDASRNLVNAMIALFIGGPHMYATYTRTALEPSFTSKHKYFILTSLLIPLAVIYMGVNYFQVLITFFFFWASVHIMHQIVFIIECYNSRMSVALSRVSRMIDYAVVFSSLYPIATYRFVNDEFWIGSTKLLFPDFLKSEYLFYFVTAVFIASLSLFVWKSVREIRLGQAHYPKLILISITVLIAFFVPAYKNLDVSFQGFNAWHSFQYLGLTFYINRLRYERGEIGSAFIAGMSAEGKTWKYYLFNVSLTLAAVAVIGSLLYFSGALGLSFDQCYYIVVLSFLLMHYFHDHLLFTNTGVLSKG